ncbi:MAG TPA: GspH/FimT family pseudopilin [Lysobacter sp.]
MERHQRGFSLVELMAALVILGVLLGVGVPAFRQLIDSMRVHNAFHELSTSLAMARMSAVSGGATVLVCPSADGRTCRQDSVWDQGWITFRASGRLQRHPISAEDILFLASSPGHGLALRSNRPRIRFQPNGLSEGSNASVCIHAPGSGPAAGRVAVNGGGRIRSELPPQAGFCTDRP